MPVLKRRTLPNPARSGSWAVWSRQSTSWQGASGESAQPRSGQRRDVSRTGDEDGVNQLPVVRLKLRPRRLPVRSRGIRRRARETVLEVPSHAGVPRELSGRQPTHGRKPASAAAAALGKWRQFFSFAVGAGQIRRQSTMLPTTPMKNLPSNRGSRASRAGEHMRQSRFMFFARPYLGRRASCVFSGSSPQCP
jgi:hypothetical protein